MYKRKKGKTKMASVTLLLGFVFNLTARSESKQLFLQLCERPLWTEAAGEVHQKRLLL